jgi:alpha-ketoglutarate-dependent taurine dioxygenase
MKVPHYHLKDAKLKDGHVVVTWADGHESAFLYMWLRDNCSCETCGAHGEGSRFQSLLDIPEDIAPLSCTWDEQTGLTLRWASDGHETRLSGKWLRDYCYSKAERVRRRGRPTLWDGRLRRWPSIDYGAAQHNLTEFARIFAAVESYGFAFIRGMGDGYQEIERLAQMIGYVRETHYGRVYDLRIRENPSILGETSSAILPHSDETYRHVPTGINMFHCIYPATGGGGATILVDSYNVAAQMRKMAPEEFDILCKMPIQHERRIDGQIIRSQNPAFTVDLDGNVAEVRLNERTMTALSLPERFMVRTYRALRRAFRIAYDPANRIELRLETGDALIFDNLRVLHGRTAVSGDRLLRQSQVMRDEFYAKYAALQEAERVKAETECAL